MHNSKCDDYATTKQQSCHVLKTFPFVVGFPQRLTQVQSDALEIKENYFDSPATEKPISHFRENTKGISTSDS